MEQCVPSAGTADPIEGRKMNRNGAAALEAFVLGRMIDTRLPGVSLALVANGTVVHQSGLGFRHLERRLAVTPQTLFGIGSITKVFTAVAILQLRDRGLLQLDDPVDRYIALPLKPAGQPIGIWHFLSHTSGIPALGFSESKMSDRWFMAGFPIADDEDLLTFMHGAESWVHAPPGERWFYLNEGYVLLGSIIEKVTGQTYVDYVTEHILQPLGMERSYFTREQVEGDPDHATPYLRDRDNTLFVGSNLYSPIPAAGGLVSSVEDMARFALLFLNEGRTTAGAPLISPESLQMMMEPRVRLPHEEEPGFPEAETWAQGDDVPPEYAGYYGYGLQIYPNFYGNDLVGHGGGVMGGTSYLAVVPDRQVGVVLLANGHGYPMGQLAMYALAGLLGQDPEHLPFVRRDRLLNELCGDYESFRSTIRGEVLRKGDILELQIHFHHEDRVVPFIPVELGDHTSQFLAFSGGRRVAAEFVRSETSIDLVYERYKLRKL